MASKYDRLAAHLRYQRGAHHTMQFGAIEELTGSSLPASARDWHAWWANDRTHTHARFGWLAAGWEVDAVDQFRETVMFRRSVGHLGY